MRPRLAGGAAAAVLMALWAGPNVAHAAPAPGETIVAHAEASPGEAAKPRRARKKAEKKPGKEPSSGQLAARERQKTCSAEWKVVKAGGKVEAGMKWPAFYSQCNARLKGEKA